MFLLSTSTAKANAPKQQGASAEQPPYLPSGSMVSGLAAACLSHLEVSSEQFSSLGHEYMMIPHILMYLSVTLVRWIYHVVDGICIGMFPISLDECVPILNLDCKFSIQTPSRVSL